MEQSGTGSRVAIDPELERIVAAVAGSPLVAAEHARWGFANRTDLVTTADGDRLAVQRLTGPDAARARLRVAALDDALRAAGVPVPRLVAGDAAARPPFIVTELVEGVSGGSLMDDPVDAIALATEMGRLASRVAAVDQGAARAAGLDGTWAQPARLAAAASGWLEAARASLGIRAAGEAGRLVGRIGGAFAGRPAVLAHGDFVPVNAVVRGRAVVALVDWEDAQLADPLLDPAWWAWIVWHHHNNLYPAAAPALFETAGIELDAATVERMRILVVARQLEVLATRLAGDRTGRRARAAERLRETLAADAW